MDIFKFFIVIFICTIMIMITQTDMTTEEGVEFIETSRTNLTTSFNEKIVENATSYTSYTEPLMYIIYKTVNYVIDVGFEVAILAVLAIDALGIEVSWILVMVIAVGGYFSAFIWLIFKFLLVLLFFIIDGIREIRDKRRKKREGHNVEEKEKRR